MSNRLPHSKTFLQKRELIPRVTRHTFASILIAAGHNPKYIQSQLGHASIQITADLYVHLMPEVHEGAAKKLEDFVFSPEQTLKRNANETEQEKGVTACAVTP